MQANKTAFFGVLSMVAIGGTTYGSAWVMAIAEMVLRDIGLRAGHRTFLLKTVQIERE